MASPAGYFLRTTRLGFRTWQPDDLPRALHLWGDAEVSRFISAGGPPSAEAIAARLARERTTQAEHGIQYWPVFLLEGDAHVGCCGVRPYRDDPGVREFGVHLLPAYWGRGLAKEAARAGISFAFGRLGVRALFAGHNPANTASRTMLLALGFRYTHDELYPPTGLQHPSYLLERPV